MTKRKPGRPPTPPVESPHWIPYAAALQEATERFRSEQLAIAKLDAALASGTIRCKIERIGAKPQLMKRSDQVAAVFLPDGEQDGWEERPTSYLNDEPQSGWLFLWDYDRINFFNISAEAGPAIAVKTQETPVAVGHPVVHDWREIMLFAVQAYLDSRALKANAIVHKLEERLEAAGIKVPASELQKAVRQVLAFDKRHQLMRKLFSETQ
jgi:hypothetical protein